MNQFINRLKILHGIDAYEIEEALGREMLRGQWQAFRDDPLRFMIVGDDAMRAAIWTIIMRREAPQRPI